MTDVGFLDRLLGREDTSRQQTWNRQQDRNPSGAPQRPRTDDEAAIDRYRHMLRTAPPDQVEQAHAEAFAKLTPQQRRQVLADLSEAVPPGERAQSDDPRSLARMATRAELRQPGTMERALGRGGGIGMGGMIAGGLLASVAGAFVGTAIADAMFDVNDSGESSDAADAGDPGSGDGGDYGDGGGFDGGGGDFGGDVGGGDFGGF
jgi:hypothetical protein